MININIENIPKDNLTLVDILSKLNMVNLGNNFQQSEDQLIASGITSEQFVQLLQAG